MCNDLPWHKVFLTISSTFVMELHVKSEVTSYKTILWLVLVHSVAFCSILNVVRDASFKRNQVGFQEFGNVVGDLS